MLILSMFDTLYPDSGAFNKGFTAFHKDILEEDYPAKPKGFHAAREWQRGWDRAFYFRLESQRNIEYRINKRKGKIHNV